MRELSLMERLVSLSAESRADVLSQVPDDWQLDVLQSWRWTARPSQLAPEGDWSQWLILAGRGFGKTRAGAEWVTDMARRSPGARFALVGATAHDAATVMVEGESGLVSVAPDGFQPSWTPSRRLLSWPNGAQASLLSAVEPNQLRGPQFHFALCDELAAWPKPREAWDNLRMGLRLGQHPQAVVTTTPRALLFLKSLLAMPGTVVTRGGDSALCSRRGFFVLSRWGRGLHGSDSRLRFRFERGISVDETSRFHLPLLIAGQGQKEITHNEALLLLDAAVGAVVERRDVLVPPEDAVAGQCWLVPEGATLDWDGHADEIAVWTQGGWRFLTAPDGFTVLVKGEQLRICRLGAAWQPQVPIGAPAAPIALPLGGEVVDLEARLALARVLERLIGLGLVQP